MRQNGLDAPKTSLQTRERIICAARELFAARGFNETSVREIARRSGISDPAIYHYFPTKHAILDELLVVAAPVERDRQVVWGAREREAAICRLAEVFLASVHREETLRVTMIQALQDSERMAGFIQHRIDSFRSLVCSIVGSACGEQFESCVDAIVFQVSGLLWDTLIRTGPLYREAVSAPAFEERLVSLLGLVVPPAVTSVAGEFAAGELNDSRAS